MSADADLQRKVLELRKAGASLERTATSLGVTLEEASDHLAQALGALTHETHADLRLIEIERLDSLQRALWPRALEGHWLSIDRCLAIMERRAALLGLDGALETGQKDDALDELVARRAVRRAGTAPNG